MDLGFSGYMLHEVADPSDLVSQIAKAIRPGGEYAVFDFISGNEDAFVKAFMEIPVSAFLTSSMPPESYSAPPPP